MAAVRKDRNMNVSTDVTRYIKGRANELVTIDEICDGLDLTPEQVRYAMRRLLEKTTLGRYIDVVTRGNSWAVGSIPGSKSKPKAAPAPERVYNPLDEVAPEDESNEDLIILERVGRLGDGTDVLRTPNGNLWKLLPL